MGPLHEAHINISTAGTFSLLNSQLVVGTLAGPRGSELKGLAISMPNRLNDHGIPMGEIDAQASSTRRRISN